MNKKEDVKVILPPLTLHKQIRDDLAKYAKLKGYPEPLARRRALVLWLNKQRKDLGEEEYHYPLSE